MKTFYSDITNAFTKRGSKPTTDAGDDEPVKPKRTTKNARKGKSATKAAPRADVTEEVPVAATDRTPARSTRSKAKADVDETPKIADAPMEETTKQETKPKGKSKAKTTTTKEVIAKTQVEVAASKTEVRAEAVPAAKMPTCAEATKTEDIEDALASMALDDSGESLEATNLAPSPVVRKSRFGRKLTTPKKYKDYISGAAHRNKKSE